ncbi:MAG TPA: tetratricopeptide repeat protein [Ohtaekwangia sp.]|nr:tetratricopeptide repeat protein [Ohtaekwangia sp.]
MRLSLFILFILVFRLSVSSQNRLSIDSLEEVLKKHPHDTNSIRTSNLLGIELVRSDTKKAKAHLLRAITLANNLNTTAGLSTAYSQLTTIYHNSNELDSASYYLSKLKNLADEYPAQTNRANYYLTAGLYAKKNGNYKEAIIFMIEGLRFMEGPAYQTTKAGQLLNIGNAYFKLGDLKNAADYHIQALTIFETLNNKRGQSFCLQSLGSDFLALGEYESAATYLKRSMVIKQQENDVRGIITAWNALGQVNRRLEKTGEARTYFSKALEKARELNLQLEQLSIIYQFGLLEKEVGNLIEARKLFATGLKLAEASNNKLSIVDFKAQLASIDSSSNETQTENVLVKKIRMASNADDKPMLADGHYQLALWYAEKNQFREAFDHMRQYTEMNDSLRGSSVLMQLRTLEKKYETEKKENEIMLLKKDQTLKNAIIAKQKSNQILVVFFFCSVVVVASLLANRYRIITRAKRQLEIERVRNTIARDLHDDIGSTLSSINILSKVALLESTNAIPHLQRIAKNSSRMMENMADIVWSIHPTNDSLEKIVIRINEFASEILEPLGIKYTIDIADKIKSVRLDVAHRKNIFMIIKEAINNIAKYSEASEVTISIKQNDKSIVLLVSDNGKGFDQDVIKNGNGLQNMAGRARDIHGVLVAKSIPGCTTVELTLPVTS